MTENVVRIEDATVAEVSRGTNAVYGGYGFYGTKEGSASQNVIGNRIYVEQGTVIDSNVFGGYSEGGDSAVSKNVVTISGGSIGSEEDSFYEIYGGYRAGISGDVTDNVVKISGEETGTTLKASVYGGYTYGEGTVRGNKIQVAGGRIQQASQTITIWDGGLVPKTVTSALYGGYAAGDGEVVGNLVDLSGGIIETDVYGGYSAGAGTVRNNTIALSGTADVAGASLYGSNQPAEGSEGNVLAIDSWSGSVKNVKNFNTLTLQNIHWENGGTVLSITDGTTNALADTEIHLKNVVFDGGTQIQAGDSMTFINGNGINLGIQEEKVDIDQNAFSAGVAASGVGQISVSTEGEIQYTVKTISRSAQTDVVAGNRLAGAAFVNQGADIAAESLHLLDDGYHWGTQTFGAVYGNRSTYDAAGDVKINGWSEIVGVGNIHRVDGGRLAWGVFYENGTGNYRTWNEFNNEMFRGDGSLVYNGGGAAVRLTKDSGLYYEASLRMGNLSSSMTDAVRDGDGNSYGFDSDSTYWGAHIGAGKLIESGSGQWDIYGKYFHTDIDGDSFVMGGDRFSFDSVTSDRLRLGARYMPATDAAWKVYYGAAYEYEFSGDSHMKAGRFDAPEQSLQGSTVFGEIGTVWGRKDSDWSVDVNLRGYAGEREGFSGMVQLAYAF